MQLPNDPEKIAHGELDNWADKIVWLRISQSFKVRAQYITPLA